MGNPQEESPWGFPTGIPPRGSPWGFPSGIPPRDSPWGFPMGIPHGDSPWGIPLWAKGTRALWAQRGPLGPKKGRGKSPILQPRHHSSEPTYCHRLPMGCPTGGHGLSKICVWIATGCQQGHRLSQSWVATGCHSHGLPQALSALWALWALRPFGPFGPLGPVGPLAQRAR